MILMGLFQHSIFYSSVTLTFYDILVSGYQALGDTIEEPEVTVIFLFHSSISYYHKSRLSSF